MPLYDMVAGRCRAIGEASLSALKVREGVDLQRLLRSQIAALGDDLPRLAKEPGEWKDGRHGIELLTIDREVNFVVIELKPPSYGCHMEMQGLRYAAMVFRITFERAERVHADFLGRNGE